MTLMRLTLISIYAAIIGLKILGYMPLPWWAVIVGPPIIFVIAVYIWFRESNWN